jgi:hypothetical protein
MFIHSFDWNKYSSRLAISPSKQAVLYRNIHNRWPMWDRNSSTDGNGVFFPQTINTNVGLLKLIAKDPSNTPFFHTSSWKVALYLITTFFTVRDKLKELNSFSLLYIKLFNMD